MAADYPTDLDSNELAEALRRHGSSVESVMADLADAVESDGGPTASDLDTAVIEVLELLALLGDTIAPGIEPAGNLTPADYETVSDTAQDLIERLDSEVRDESDGGNDDGGTTSEQSGE
jgi:hypothetical protein